MDKKFLEERTIYSVITGSTLYGLNVETSDQDIKNIVKPTDEMLYVLGQLWETTAFKNPDIEFHSLKKTVELLNTQNPTIMEMIFAPRDKMLVTTSESDYLIENRHLFLSQNCYNSFGGYAKGELIKIKRALNVTSEEEATFEEKVNWLLERKKIRDGFTLKSVKEEEGHLFVHFEDEPYRLDKVANFVDEAYKAKKKVDKSSKSKQAKLGFKNAMHLTRLLKMGTEVLKTGELIVDRSFEREGLLSIRKGELSWEDFFAYTDELFLELEKAKKNSVLPLRTDSKKIQKLLYELHR